MSSLSTPLLSLGPEALTRVLGGPGRARMVFRSLAAGRHPMSDPAVPDGIKRRLEAVTEPPAYRVLRTDVAADQTTKLLVDATGEGPVETVLIPGNGRTTLCLSSQLGCVRGCSFCLTATMGLRANLSVSAILSQVHVGLKTQRERNLPPLRNLVFMGMGEPLDNWSAVSTALETLTHDRGFGFGQRHITVSTVGPSPRAIHRLSGCTARIAWSLHAASDAVRHRLVPSQRHSTMELMDGFSELFSDRRDPLFVEMTLMREVNDSLQDAEEALRLIDRFPNEVRFNLLPMNPTGRGLFPSPPVRVQAFAERLRKEGLFVRARRARGQETSAACGQLAVLQSPQTS